jgi:tRNA(His) 5'-end guanylyltransferase
VLRAREDAGTAAQQTEMRVSVRAQASGEMSDTTRDGLGARMKSQYEDRARFMLPRRTWTVIRADGKAFHTFTRWCVKPFDANLHAAMVSAAVRLAEEAQGAKFGYVQSDEISIVLTDFDRIETCAWFDGNVQKIASVAASIITAEFNRAWQLYDVHGTRDALFDTRVFTIPDSIEVENYLIWRQKDAIRNSISSLAQAHFSPKQLHGKKQADMLSMLAERGVDWSNSPSHVKHGTSVVRASGLGWGVDYETPVFTDRRSWLQEQLQVNKSEQEYDR